MSYKKLTHKISRYALGILLALLALNAFGGGYYGMTGARGVPIEWLTGSPFNDYFIPALILFLFVGGSALIAAIAVFRGNSHARDLAFLSVAIVLLWLFIQLAIIGYVSWLQPTTAVTAFVILFLTWKLPRYGY